MQIQVEHRVNRLKASIRHQRRRRYKNMAIYHETGNRRYYDEALKSKLEIANLAAELNHACITMDQSHPVPVPVEVIKRV